MSSKSKDGRKSKVWQYFEQIGEEVAQCSICKRQFSYKSSSASNLNKHLKRVHSVVMNSEPQTYSVDAVSSQETASDDGSFWEYLDSDNSDRIIISIADVESTPSDPLVSTYNGEIAKVKRKTSAVWQFYDKLNSIDALCKLCQRTFSHRTSLTNLKKHLDSRHPTAEIGPDGMPTEISNNVAPTPAKTHGKTSQEMINRKRSVVWQLFKPVDEYHAKCNLCKKICSNSTISNLKKHVVRKHPMVKIDLQGQKLESFAVSKIEPSTADTSSPVIPAVVGRNRVTSFLWKYFRKIDRSHAKCSFCKQIFSFKSSTSNLKKHLLAKHSKSRNRKLSKLIVFDDTLKSMITPEADATDDDLNDTQEEPESSTSIKIAQFTHTKSSQSKKNFILSVIDRQLLKFLIKDFQPSIVQDPGFREFVSALQPHYELPSREDVSKIWLPNVYEQCLSNTRNLISTGRKFCITVDTWVSDTSRYVTLTAHFLDENFKLHSILLECLIFHVLYTADNLAAELTRVVKEWNIHDTIILAVAEKVDHLQTAIEKVGWEYLECFAYKINLIVQEGLKQSEIQTIINKIKDIFMYMHQNESAYEILLKYQQDRNKQPVNRNLETAISWSVAYSMLQQFLDLEGEISSITANSNEEVTKVTVEESEIVKELCFILKLFDDLSKTLSRKGYYSASLIVPLCNGLKTVINKLLKKEYLQPVKEVISQLYVSLRDEIGSLEQYEALTTSAFLDPRFKNIGFEEEVTAEETKYRILALTEENITKETKTENEDTEENDNVDEEFSIWVNYNKGVAESQSKETALNRASMEMQRYMEEDFLPRNGDPFLWWQQHKAMLPRLALVAQERLCASASSVSSEQMCSDTRDILRERISQLSDRKTQMLVFLNANEKYL